MDRTWSSWWVGGGGSGGEAPLWDWVLIKCRQGATSMSGSYSDKSGMDTAGSRRDSCEDGPFTAKKLQRDSPGKSHVEESWCVWVSESCPFQKPGFPAGLIPQGKYDSTTVGKRGQIESVYSPQSRPEHFAYLFKLFFWPLSMQDLSSLTRDQIHQLCSGSEKSWPLDW